MRKSTPPLEGQAGKESTRVAVSGNSDAVKSAMDVPPAAPSQKVGLEVHNGSGQHFMSSDASPALDQGISPAWTGSHDFRKQITVPTMPASDSSANAASTAFVVNRIRQSGARVINVDSSATIVTIEEPLTIVCLLNGGSFEIDFFFNNDDPITYGKVVVASYQDPRNVLVRVHMVFDDGQEGAVSSLKFAGSAYAGSFEVVHNSPQQGVNRLTHFLAPLYGFVSAG